MTPLQPSPEPWRSAAWPQAQNHPPAQTSAARPASFAATKPAALPHQWALLVHADISGSSLVAKRPAPRPPLLHHPQRRQSMARPSPRRARPASRTKRAHPQPSSRPVAHRSPSGGGANAKRLPLQTQRDPQLPPSPRRPHPAPAGPHAPHSRHPTPRPRHRRHARRPRRRTQHRPKRDPPLARDLPPRTPPRNRLPKPHQTTSSSRLTPQSTRIARPDEAATLIAALPLKDHALWATALYAGLRRGELQALRWKDIDLDQNLLHVHRSWDRIEGP